MTNKTNYLTRFPLFIALCLTFNFSFAQNCGQLTIDSISNPGEYTFDSMTESDGIRNGPDYSGATLYYPTNAVPPFTGIVIVPGYLSPQSSIQNWGPFLASHGIVTMTIGTISFFDQPEDRRDALLDALITLKEENRRSGSPLLGTIDTTRLAVGGWSMGGGGAQLAAGMDPNLKAVMALCPWLDEGSLTPSDLNHAIPTLIFSAENDAIAPHALHADVHYDYTPLSTSKMLFEIAGGDHSVANSPIGGGGDVGKIAISWLKNFLVGDTCYCPLVLDTPPSASEYLLNVECSDFASLEEGIYDESNGYRLYPNPTNGGINLEVEKFAPEFSYQIFSMTGTKVNSGEVESQSTRIELHELDPGIYLFNITTKENTTQIRFIIH